MKILIALLVLFSVSAQGLPHELDGYTGTSLSFDDDTEVKVGIGYNFPLTSALQFGFDLAYDFDTNAGTSISSHLLRFQVGPVFNLSLDEEGIKNAFFFNPSAGLVHFSVGATKSTEFVFGAILGKRFALTDSVCYRPSVGFFKVDGSKVEFILSPFALSVLL